MGLNVVPKAPLATIGRTTFYCASHLSMIAIFTCRAVSVMMLHVRRNHQGQNDWLVSETDWGKTTACTAGDDVAGRVGGFTAASMSS